MASEGGGKIKSKRGHSSSKPYERRKSLFSRITESIKEVLRPSWLAADDVQGASIGDGHAGPSSTDEVEEDEFVSPAQSPSQLLPSLSGRGGGVRTGEASSPSGHPQGDGGMSGGTTGDGPLQWLHTSQGLSTSSSNWDSRGRGPTKSTWSNSTPALDKAQISKSFFAQRLLATGTKAAGNSVETTSRGLGGLAPSPATTTAMTSSPLTAIHERLGRSGGELESPATTTTAPHGPSGHHHRQELTDSVLAPMSPASSSTSDSVADENPSKRQRLWSPDNERTRQSLAAHRPAFKVSVFSSPQLSESMHESSFYSGRTAYGGASAYRRANASLNSSLPYRSALPIRKSVTAKPLDNSGNAVLSSSAAQILKTLERLSDTKKSRINETDTESLLSFTPQSYRRPSRPLQTSLPSRSLEVSMRGPPIHHRQSPVAASIAKNRQIVSLPSQRPVPAPSTSGAAARGPWEVREMDQGDGDQGQVIDMEEQRTATSQRAEFTEPASRSSGKMKHQKSYDTRGRTRKPSGEEEDVQELPNLRTDFTLPISSMPAINLGFPGLSNKLLSTASSAGTTSKAGGSGSPLTKASSPSVIQSSSVSSPPKLQFTFSSPIHKSAPGPAQPSASPVLDFQFSSPLKVSDSVSSDRHPSSGASTSGFGFNPSGHNAVPAWGSTEAKPKPGVSKSTPGSSDSSTAVNKPASSSMSFGLGAAAVGSSSSGTSTFGGGGGALASPASQLRSGSVMDILGKSPPLASSSSSSFSASPLSGFKAAGELKQQGSVMDVLGGKNDGKFGSSSPLSSSSSSSGLKPAAELKQGSVMDILGKPASSASASGSLMAQFAPPAGSWECSECMLRNNADASKCVACRAARPAQRGKDARNSSSSSGGANSLSAQFAPPAGSWECGTCLINNQAVDQKCVACQTPKPKPPPPPAASGSKPSTSKEDSLFAKFAPPSGSWECGACMLQNKAEAANCVACTTPKPGASSGSKASSTKGDSLFAKFAPPSGSWECGACMLQNKAEAAKCVACQTPKPGASSGSKPSTSKEDSLFAKFAPPSGSWECGACMLQNKAEATNCVACTTPKPGASPAASSSKGPPDPLMAKFKRPSGSWECDMCMVPNGAGRSKCVACQSPRPGATSTGTKPPPAPTIQVAAGGGFTFAPQSSSSSAPSPFAAAATSSSSAPTSSATGFTYVPPTSSSSKSEGFRPGSSSSSSKASFPGGFKFGQQESSNSAPSSQPPAGFSFGAKDSSSSNSEATLLDKAASSSSLGFKFGVPSPSSVTTTTTTTTTSSVGFVFGASSASSGSASTPSSSTTPSVTGFGSTASSGLGGFQFGVPAKTSNQGLADKGDKLTSNTSAARFTPVFGSGQASNSFALGAAPSAPVIGSSLTTTTGGFQFQGVPPNSGAKDPAPSPFVSGLVTSPSNDSSKSDSAAKLPSAGFAFPPATAKPSSDAAAAKPGLFPDSSQKNGVSSSVPSCSASTGFAFGAGTTSLSANPFSSVPQLSSASSFAAPSAAKLPVNGEVGAPAPFSFGQQAASKPSVPGGFAFPLAPAAGSSGNSNPLTQTKAFGGFDAGKSAGEKRHLDNDVGPTAVKKRVGPSSSLGGSEGFKFGNSAPGAGSNLFKFGPPSQGTESVKSGNVTAFGGPASSGFGGASSTQGGFAFPSSVQSNAASSTGPQQPASLFGAGAGGTGGFSFGSQSNAAAASPFGSEAPPAPSQGFNFSGATQPSFNFGGNNTPAPVFQFGPSQSVDPAPAQPAAGGLFLFGQSATPSADSTALPSTFPPPNPAASFGAAPAQGNFNIGSEGPRKIKRAVRRQPRK